MSDLHEGFKAAAAGDPRDVTRSHEWLEGYDGHAIGRAENHAKQTAQQDWLNHPNEKAARKAAKAKARRKGSGNFTTRTIG